MGHLSRYVTSHPGQLSVSIHSWVGTMHTSQRVVMPWSWGIKADMVRVWLASKTVWSLVTHRPHMSTLIEMLHDYALYKFISRWLYVYLLYCILHCNTTGQLGFIYFRATFTQLAPVIRNNTQAQTKLTAVIKHRSSLFHIDNLRSRNHQQSAAQYINIPSSSSLPRLTPPLPLPPSSSSLPKLLLFVVFFISPTYYHYYYHKIVHKVPIKSTVLTPVVTYVPKYYINLSRRKITTRNKLSLRRFVKMNHCGLLAQNWCGDSISSLTSSQHCQCQSSK